MIVKEGNQCYEYDQQQIRLLDEKNISKGIKVVYKWKERNPVVANVSTIRELTFACDNSGRGCPDVERSTIFTYFKNNQLGFMIAMEIIGIIFMIFGLYIYRASIVLLGACTMFFILLAI